MATNVPAERSAIPTNRACGTVIPCWAVILQHLQRRRRCLQAQQKPCRMTIAVCSSPARRLPLLSASQPDAPTTGCRRQRICQSQTSAAAGGARAGGWGRIEEATAAANCAWPPFGAPPKLFGTAEHTTTHLTTWHAEPRGEIAPGRPTGCWGHPDTTGDGCIVGRIGHLNRVFKTLLPRPHAVPGAISRRSDSRQT